MNLVFSTRLPRISLAALALVGAAIAAPRLASAAYPIVDSNITIAAPTIDITPAQAAAGYSGYFDVTITDSTTQNLAQFQAQLNLAGPGTNVQIVGADLAQASNGEFNDPTNNAYQAGVPDGIGDAAGASPNFLNLGEYVLAQTGYATNNSGLLTNGGYVAFDSTQAQNSDSTNSGVVSMVAGTSYDLMQVYFTIAPGTGAGSYALTFDTNAPYNNAAGQTANDVNADFVNTVSNSNLTSYAETSVSVGAIVVLSPEPGSIVLMVLGMVGLIGVGVRRARRA
jgi:hypothetical protein